MPVVNTKEFNTEFPENKIVLLNGMELICYPKAEPMEEVKDEGLSLDMTGQYFSIGKNTKAMDVKIDSGKALFTDNAFCFFRNIDRIFSDSRMFLAPVPIRNGLAYTGTSGFNTPTLGVYLEWWLNCEVDLTKDKKGRDALTYHIAGSPLSGMNHCTCVYPDGKVKSISHYPFRDVWSMFMKINNRYSEAKARYDAYSLTEVLRILLESEGGNDSELASSLLVEEAHKNVAVRQLERLKKSYKALEEKFNELSVLFHKKELEEFRTEYMSRRESVALEIESIDRRRTFYKKRMKQGEISNVEYQRFVKTLTRKKKDLEFQLAWFKRKRMDMLVKSGHMSYAAVEAYLGEGGE